MEKIFELQFIVPPTLFIIFIFILNPFTFLNKIEQIGITVSITIITAVILGLGFIFSSIVRLIINLFNLFKQHSAEKEIKEWREVKDEGELISSKYQKKWDMAMANFNSCIALFFALIFGINRHNNYYFLQYNHYCIYHDYYLNFCIYSTLILMGVFLLNGIIAYKRATDIDSFLTAEKRETKENQINDKKLMN